MTMRAMLTIMRNLILSRRVRKSALVAWIDATDADRDGYISVKEALDSMASAIRRFGEDE